MVLDFFPKRDDPCFGRRFAVKNDYNNNNKNINNNSTLSYFKTEPTVFTEMYKMAYIL